MGAALQVQVLNRVKYPIFPTEASVQDINPIVSDINALKGRVSSLRGYL
jgi:hypothetical protein